MSDPTGRSEEERAREVLREQADAASRLDPAWVERYQDEARLAEQPEQIPAPERLFSRKVLFGWAFATLVFVFIIRMVIPTVFETIKANIEGKMRPPTSNTAAPAIPEIPAIPAIPAIPPVPAVPAVEAPERPEAKERPEIKERPEASSTTSGTTAPAAKKK